MSEKIRTKLRQGKQDIEAVVDPDLVNLAHYLGKSPVELLQMWQNGDILGLTARQNCYVFPSWQLFNRSLIPHLKSIISAIPKNIGLETLNCFFFTPHQDLLSPEGKAVSPWGWLVEGGDPYPVIRLLKKMHVEDLI